MSNRGQEIAEGLLRLSAQKLWAERFNPISIPVGTWIGCFQTEDHLNWRSTDGVWQAQLERSINGGHVSLAFFCRELLVASSSCAWRDASRAKHWTGFRGSTNSGVSMPMSRKRSSLPSSNRTSTVSPSTTRTTSAAVVGETWACARLSVSATTHPIFSANTLKPRQYRFNWTALPRRVCPSHWWRNRRWPSFF
jgi:hypothetical protein